MELSHKESPLAAMVPRQFVADSLYFEGISALFKVKLHA
jgi:hypothetical protein